MHEDRTESSGQYDKVPEDRNKNEEDLNNVEEEFGTEDDAETKTHDDEENMARQFKDEDYEGVVFMEDDDLCNLQDKAGIPSIWMLLDSQFTVVIFYNSRMLSNICDANRDLILHFNAGTMAATKKGNLKRYGTIWYHPTAITNILSLNNVKKKYRSTLTVN